MRLSRILHEADLAPRGWSDEQRTKFSESIKGKHAKREAPERICALEGCNKTLLPYQKFYCSREHLRLDFTQKGFWGRLRAQPPPHHSALSSIIRKLGNGDELVMIVNGREAGRFTFPGKGGAMDEDITAREMELPEFVEYKREALRLVVTGCRARGLERLAESFSALAEGEKPPTTQGCRAVIERYFNAGAFNKRVASLLFEMTNFKYAEIEFGIKEMRRRGVDI